MEDYQRFKAAREHVDTAETSNEGGGLAIGGIARVIDRVRQMRIARHDRLAEKHAQTFEAFAGTAQAISYGDSHMPSHPMEARSGAERRAGVRQTNRREKRGNASLRAKVFRDVYGTTNLLGQMETAEVGGKPAYEMFDGATSPQIRAHNAKWFLKDGEQLPEGRGYGYQTNRKVTKPSDVNTLEQWLRLDSGDYSGKHIKSELGVARALRDAEAEEKHLHQKMQQAASGQTLRARWAAFQADRHAEKRDKIQAQ